MDTILCDELIQEIFHRLPPPCSAVVSLVCKRWLHLLRSSTTKLSLSFIEPPFIPLFSSFLTCYTYLSTVNITTTSVLDSSDQILCCVVTSCPNLKHLRFLAGPVSTLSLFNLSTCCPNLVSLAVSVFRPLSFCWLASFRSLKELAVYLDGSSGVDFVEFCGSCDVELNLERLSLSGIQSGDKGVSWLWRNCKKLRSLKLKSCEGVGDHSSFFAFLECLEGLQEVELRSCRKFKVFSQPTHFFGIPYLPCGIQHKL